ncbi:MAG: hypothetical protein JWP97_3522 [Labilithrix sp.]|nr:hypothetical protein [Labilithrix sp.]
MAPKVPSIKGLVFREFVRWYEQSHGRDAAMRAYTALPDDLRFHLQPDLEAFGLVASTWYPCELAGAMLQEVTLGVPPLRRAEMLRSGVQHALGVTLTGVYKMLFDTLITPERHAKYAQKIWSQYYNTGVVTGAMEGEMRSSQLVTDWTGHHPMLCELSISSLAVFHEAMGCKNVRVRRTSCVLDAALSARHAERLNAEKRHPSTKLSAAAPARTAPESSSRMVAAPPPSSSGSLVPACRFLIQWDGRG